MSQDDKKPGLVAFFLGGKNAVMALNMKSDQVTRMAQQLAELTGESITEAAGKAIEARLAEL